MNTHAGISGETMPAGQADTLAAKAAARKLIEGTTLSQGAIAGRLDLPTTTLSNWKRREGWVRPDGAPTLTAPGETRVAKPERRRREMIRRLYTVFERQMTDLEARATKVGETTEEKDARALGTLARTLGTLIALEQNDDASAGEPERVTPDDIRAKLAHRLFALGRRGEGPA